MNKREIVTGSAPERYHPDRCRHNGSKNFRHGIRQAARAEPALYTVTHNPYRKRCGKTHLKTVRQTAVRIIYHEHDNRKRHTRGVVPCKKTADTHNTGPCNRVGPPREHAGQHTKTYINRSRILTFDFKSREHVRKHHQKPREMRTRNRQKMRTV